MCPASVFFVLFFGLAQAAEPFFITLDQVELKNSESQWITVIRPDRRLDLAKEDPAIRFFNNGRIPSGEYTNVRVHFTAEEDGKKAMTLERAEDYSPALTVKKGTFIGVAFSLDGSPAERLSARTVKEVRLIADQDERIDGGDRIKLWS